MKKSRGETVTAIFLGLVFWAAAAIPLENNPLSGRAQSEPAWSWGNNYYGQLGDGTFINSPIPVQSGNASDWDVVSTKDVHTVALRADGTLWAWGENEKGQLGNGATTNSAVPLQITASVEVTRETDTGTITETVTETTWAQASAGGDHVVAIGSSGRLWAWGENTYGQLGDGTGEDSSTPALISEETTWAALAAGGWHTMALKVDGTLWGWGYNTHGELGDGTGIFATAPIQIGTETNWAAVSASFMHTAAIKSDGTLWAWGYNGYGQLGDGTNISSYIPLQVGTDTDWVEVSAGYLHTAALKADGTLWTWGRNDYGQLGNGTDENASAPTQVGTDNDWAAVSAGGWHTAAIKADGSLWTWGSNYHGQLGNGNAVDSYTPVKVGTATVPWESVSSGYSYTAALMQGPSTTRTQILGMTSDLTAAPEPGETFRVAVNAVASQGENLLYRFLARSGYGTPEWSTSSWQVLQDWSPVKWVGASFAIPDNYFVACHVIALEDGQWAAGDPQAGFTVRVSGAIQVQGLTSNLLGTPQPGETFRVTAHAVGPEGGALAYQFFYRAGYGTPEWENNTWQLLQGWSPVGYVDAAFGIPGTYYVACHVIGEGDTWEAGDPQAGFTVAVE